MVDVALMIEGQRGLTWPRWQRIVRASEELGFAALYRSDHLIEAQPPDAASLELWTSLTWLAANTQRIEFGPLVSPLTFRHPVHLAHTAVSLAELSNGRFTLGVGAGWSRREHAMYGFEMYPPAERLDRMEEGLRIIAGLLRSAKPVTYPGRHFSVQDAVLVPRPERAPTLLVAGRGRRRSLPLAAAHGDAWNVMFVSPAELRDLNAELDDLLAEFGRRPADLHRTVMQSVEVGRTDAELAAKREVRAWQFWREAGLVAGTATDSALRDRVDEFAAAGAERVILQWQDLDDFDGLEILARAVL
jgi:alkanesulfonate monooxygenase SsuD/methylene tetrahydromethanopterin reductase-like flavin-dependent oxidoreductase (luciferase family)